MAQMIQNPLKELLAAGEREKCWELIAPIFEHPDVASIPRRYECSLEDIQSEVFLKLHACKPKRPISNLGGWLFTNIKALVRRQALKQKKEVLLQGGNDEE